MLNDEDELEVLALTVQENLVPAPKAEKIQQWSQERLAEDAVKLYADLQKSIRAHLKIRKDEDGVIKLPSVKVMELAADMLKLRDPGGISINQNFGGNTTINNSGTTVTFEDLVRRQQKRSSENEHLGVIDAEIIEVEDVSPDQAK